MKRKIRKSLRRPLTYFPFPVLERIVRRKVINLFYHLVSDQPQPHVRHLYPYRPVELFEQDLVHIKRHYQPISYSQLVGGKFNDRGEQKPAVHISFDDGFAECFNFARPLLLKYGIPCTFFLTTNFIDNASMYYRNKVSLCIEKVLNGQEGPTADDLAMVSAEFGSDLANREEFVSWIKSITDESVVERICKILGLDTDQYLIDHKPYLTRSQILTLAADGFSLGAHSRRHQKLVRLSQPEMEAEIVGSCQEVAELTGQTSVPFSFPNSGDGLDRQFLRDLRHSHPEIGLVFDTKGLKPNQDGIINRIWVEAPRLNPDGKSKLPAIVKHAYRDYLLLG